MDAESTYQVFDWLWTSGQLSADDIGRLPDLGVRNVINLALPSSTYALKGEAELVTGLGLNYIHLPVTWEAPEPAQLRRFFLILQSLNEEPTWVHCARNMRVSAFVFLYRRLCLGESEETASYPLCEVWEPNPTWQQFIRDALQGHAEKPAERNDPPHANPSPPHPSP
jgi:protein tyrosine phosphatase (PTP) superfamily phosphohydrolase (DUF442 family)